MRFLLYVRVTFKATLNGGTDILFDEDHPCRRLLGKKLQAAPFTADMPSRAASM
jgi:hypothetical protein